MDTIVIDCIDATYMDIDGAMATIVERAKADKLTYVWTTDAEDHYEEISGAGFNSRVVWRELEYYFEECDDLVISGTPPV